MSRDLLQYDVLAKGFVDNIESLNAEKNPESLKQKILNILNDTSYSAAEATRRKYREQLRKLNSLPQIQFFVYNFILAAGGMGTK